MNDYRVVITGVDQPMINRLIKNYQIVDIGDGHSTDARTLASKIALIKAIKDYDLKRILPFHSKIPSAKEFSETFLQTIEFMDDNERPDGNILTDHASGIMKTSDRKEKIGQLKVSGYERGLLTNARYLSEELMSLH